LQEHGDRRGVPAAGSKSFKNTVLCSRFVKMKRLRIELSGKSFDAGLVHLVGPGAELLPHGHVV
jgi:hypothetical protein